MRTVFNLIKLDDIKVDSFGEEISFYYDIVKSAKGKILGDNERGLIMLLPYFWGYSAFFVFVREELRHKGIGKSLLDSAKEYCRRYHKNYYLKIIFNSPFSNWLEQYAVDNGMNISSNQTIYLIFREDIEGHEPLVYWYKERLVPISQRLLNRGYKISSFADAPAVMMKNMISFFDELDLDKRLVPIDMHPKQYQNLDLKLSTVCWKDESTPVSYISVSRFGDCVIIEEHFCFKEYTNRGAAIIPLCYLVQEMKLDTSIKRVSFMILDSNKEAFRMLNKQYAPFIRTSKVQKMYMLEYLEGIKMKEIEHDINI